MDSYDIGVLYGRVEKQAPIIYRTIVGNVAPIFGHFPFAECTTARWYIWRSQKLKKSPQIPVLLGGKCSQPASSSVC
jgi:hypothetical protein